MVDESPRTRAIVPSFPSSTKGGIDVWIRVVRDQVRLKLCFNIICGIPPAARPAPMRAFVIAGNVARDVDILLAGTKPLTYGDDDNAERLLPTLLWLWTDPGVDWSSFMRCDDKAVDIGTQCMWRVVSKRYKMRRTSEVRDHRRLLHDKQRIGEKLQESRQVVGSHYLLCLYDKLGQKYHLD